MNATPTDLRELSKEEVTALVADLGEKPYRAKQVWEWLWKKHAPSIDAMSDISKELRQKLTERAVLRPLVIAEQQKSTDGTIKCAFRTWDGHVVEGVLIPTEKRITACVSSQIGCSLDCSFCATGKLKRVRNLSAGEIVDQVAAISALAQEHFQRPLTNVVYMGMGEPLLNYANTMRSAERLNAPDGMGIAYRRITVSTAGIAKMIRQLGDDGAKFNLALSLHASNDEKRSSMMPINDSNSLAELMSALRHYTRLTRKEVTFEYILFKDLNDSLEDAQELVRICSRVHAKVNLIEYNTTEDGRFKKSSSEQTFLFQQYLDRKGIINRLRKSRGRDIDAACGQLANKNEAALKTGERVMKAKVAQKP